MTIPSVRTIEARTNQLFELFERDDPGARAAFAADAIARSLRLAAVRRATSRGRVDAARGAYARALLLLNARKPGGLAVPVPMTGKIARLYALWLGRGMWPQLDV